MKINNQDISVYGGSLLDYSIGRIERENDVFSFSTLLVTKTTFSQYKPCDINVTIILEQPTKQDLENEYSKLVSQLNGNIATIQFKELPDMYYDVLLDKSSDTYLHLSTKQLFTYEVKLTFKCYKKYTDEVIETADGKSTFTINNRGTMKTPCILEVYAKNPCVNLTIEGFTKKPIILGTGINAQDRLIINPINGKCTVNGELDITKFTFEEFPKLKSGTNTLKVDREDVILKITYSPMWY